MPSKVALRSKKASVLLHVVVLVDDLRVDVGDYVDGVLLRQALRGEHDLEVDILQRDGGQSQGHQCVKEVVTIVVVRGWRASQSLGASARGLPQSRPRAS